MKHKVRSLVLLTGLLCVGVTTGLAQSDVTQPGDALIASSDNSPGSEGVANAIDNQPAKYLNFDGRDFPGTPMGFIVTPSVGLTYISGVTMQSANDAVERDPKHIIIEGSNDAEVTAWNEGNWEPIYENDAIPSWESVFGPDDNRYKTQKFDFENLQPFKHYRWTVVVTQGTNMMQIAEVELLGRVVPADVTQPGDPLVASSDNSPGSEGVANAIDNQPAKYLNFDGRDFPGTPMGFIVTPSVGQTLLNGISMESANDAVERDPKHIIIEGSNDAEVTAWDEGNWDVIYENDAIPSWESVFGPDDNRYQTQTFLFPNYMPYTHYRWTVVVTQGTNMMQIAEVELLGTGAPKDTTQPGDALIASSDNSPGSEGVANAIDNQPAKYLNFDGRDFPGTPMGFIVTPSVGASTVIGVTMESANDAVERDPKHITIEGSNDAEVTAWDEGNWDVIYENDAIPSWESVFGPDDNRYKTQAFYFPNDTSYNHYRWTVVVTQGTNMMQIAEVELLAVTDQVDCEKAAFLTMPAQTPVLEGQTATLFTEVNGPWPVQWYKNGERIPGATSLTYTTDPITTANTADLYSVEIVGCEISPEVQAVIFEPSDVVSVGLNFMGGGANGSPTSTLDVDVAGVHLQAYWNNMTNSADTPANLPALIDSNGGTSSVTVEFTSGGNWGSGTGDLSPTQRLLNGLIHTGNAAGNRSTNIFHNVPAGEHSVIAYTVGIPLQFQDQDYYILDAAGNVSHEAYTTAINKDIYNPSPRWIRGSSTDPSFRTLADYVRFDNVQPDANGDIVFVWENRTDGYDRGTALNALQLLINPPEGAVPPAPVTQPISTETLDGGTVVLTVEATGADLTYQWLKNGQNIFDGGNISGTSTDTLVIRRFSSGDTGFYSVAVSNAGGGFVTPAAKVKVVPADRTITDTLTTYYKFDETGSVADAANSGSDTWPVITEGPSWVEGQINGAIDFGFTTGFVEDFTKIMDEVTVSAWVYLDSFAATIAQDIVFARNADGDLNVVAPQGQFDFGLVQAGAGTFNLRAALAAGPNIATARESVEFPYGEWQHVAFTADGRTLRLYRNGRLVAQASYLDAVNTADTPWMSMGARFVEDATGLIGVEAGDEQYFTGYMDDFGMWQFAWGQSVIESIFTQGEAGSDLTTAVLPVLPEVPVDITFTTPVLNPDGTITLEWDGAGTLQETSAIPGTWSDSADQTNGQMVPAGDGTKFYRVMAPQ